MISRYKYLLIQLAFGYFLLFPIQTFSQKKVIRTSQQWIQYYHEAKINSKWTALLDGGFRWREGFAEPAAYIVRGGVGYGIHPKIRLAVGFAHLGFYGNERVVRREFRPHQEIQYKTSFKKISLSQRLRVEERFFKEREIPTPFSDLDFNFRFRYQVLFGIPIAQLSTKNTYRKVILYLGDELFLNAGKERRGQLFDQNRLIISPSLQWSKSLSISMTYNSQFASTLIAGSYLHSRVAWLQIRHSLDFSKSAD